MKIYYLAISILLCSTVDTVSGQTAYYDAIKLKSYLVTNSNVTEFDSSKEKEVDAILLNQQYIGSTAEQTSKPDYKSNLFISPYLPNSWKNSDNKTSLRTSGVTNNITGNLGNLDVTNIASGVSSFLVKRAKEELLISVINKLQNEKKFPELPYLFPSTMTLLKSFNSWEYANVLNTLKEAFDKDLQQLLGHIPDLNKLIPGNYISDTKVYKRVCAITEFFSTPEARLYISAMKIGNGVIIGQKMPDIINVISGTDYLGDLPNATDDEENGIKLINIISYSLRSSVNGENYISKDQFVKLMDSKDIRNLYLGLLYQQFKNYNIKFGTANPIIITNLISPTDYDGISKYIQGLLSQGDDLTSAMADLSKAKKKGEKDLSIYWSAIFESAKQFLQSAENVSLIDQNLSFPDKIQQVIGYSSKALGVANDIAIRNYSAAIVDFSDFFPFDPNHPELKMNFVKYGSFVANLVQAKTSADAENAIEAVALPVGSYTVKQNASINISLNGYIGYGKDGNYAQGIYAPIGVSFSSKNLFLIPWNIHVPTTIFFPIFDVGSIATYQLNNSTTTATSTTGGTSGTSTNTINTSASNQQIKLGSIFAPGAELFFEIPKMPFAFGTGIRRTPTLSYSSGSTYSTVGARWQWNFAVLIDIPIFTLFNRTEDSYPSIKPKKDKSKSKPKADEN